MHLCLLQCYIILRYIIYYMFVSVIFVYWNLFFSCSRISFYHSHFISLPVCFRCSPVKLHGRMFRQLRTVVCVCHSGLVSERGRKPTWFLPSLCREFPVVKLFHLEAKFFFVTPLSKLAYLALLQKPVNCEPGCSCQSSAVSLQHARWHPEQRKKREEKGRHRLRWDKWIGFHQRRITKKAPATVKAPQYYKLTHT